MERRRSASHEMVNPTNICRVIEPEASYREGQSVFTRSQRAAPTVRLHHSILRLFPCDLHGKLCSLTTTVPTRTVRPWDHTPSESSDHHHPQFVPTPGYARGCYGRRLRLRRRVVVVCGAADAAAAPAAAAGCATAAAPNTPWAKPTSCCSAAAAGTTPERRESNAAAD